MILKQILERPIVRELAAAAAERAAAKLGGGLNAAERAEVERDIANDIAGNPVMVNEISAEPLSQSRTWIGGLVALFSGLATILTLFDGGGSFDADTAITAATTIAGGLATLVGRGRSGLAPAKWWNPISWFK